MALPKLVPSGEQVQVQDTTFSIDALGRFICSTWQEATGNGGPPFTAVVVGAGMYGAYCATKMYRAHPGKHILLLDAGRFLAPEHVQNLGRIGLDVPAPIPPENDPASHVPLCGECRGAATSSFPDWPTAVVGSPSTGGGGARN